MVAHPSFGKSIGLAASVGLIAVGVGGWRLTVFRAARPEVAGEPWAHVREQYPMPQEVEEPLTLSPETSEAVVAANPFSPKRRVVPVPADGGTANGGSGTAEPPKPQFAFKGLIKLGAKSRAILEDLQAHKTYFLEVGQDVAGFKVLDIAENQVLLSDPQTHEEVVVSVTSKAGP